MTEDDRLRNYLANVKRRLQVNGFRITSNVNYGNHTFSCVARAKKFYFTLGTQFETFFLFSEFSSLSTDSLSDFSTASFAYVWDKRSCPFQPLLGGSYIPFLCFPVALTDGINPIIADYVRNATPPWHWFFGYEMTVVYDLQVNSIHYSKKWPKWLLVVGLWYYWQFRKTIINMLSP